MKKNEVRKSNWRFVFMNFWKTFKHRKDYSFNLLNISFCKGRYFDITVFNFYFSFVKSLPKYEP